MLKIGFMLIFVRGLDMRIFVIMRFSKGFWSRRLFRSVRYLIFRRRVFKIV